MNLLLEEEGREKCGWGRERWELRKPTVSVEQKRGQKGLVEICILLAKGSWRGKA